MKEEKNPRPTPREAVLAERETSELRCEACSVKTTCRLKNSRGKEEEKRTVKKKEKGGATILEKKDSVNLSQECNHS